MTAIWFQKSPLYRWEIFGEARELVLAIALGMPFGAAAVVFGAGSDGVEIARRTFMDVTGMSFRACGCPFMEIRGRAEEYLSASI